MLKSKNSLELIKAIEKYYEEQQIKGICYSEKIFN